MKKFQWLILIGLVAYHPVHTSLNEMAAGFAATPSFGFGGSGCDPDINNNC